MSLVQNISFKKLHTLCDVTIFFTINLCRRITIISIFWRWCYFFNFFHGHKSDGINHDASTRCRKSNVRCQKKRHANFFNWYSRFFSTRDTHGLRGRRVWMFHCISHGKIPYNALQIYLIFYALLFLSVAASRMADGISRIIDSIWLMSIFFVPTRDNTRTHVGENACRCEFNYFRSEAQALSPLLYGSLTYRKRAPERAWEGGNVGNCVLMCAIYSAQYVVMNFLGPKCDATAAVPYEPVEKKLVTQTRKSFWRSRAEECGVVEALIFSFLLYTLSTRKRIMISAK